MKRLLKISLDLSLLSFIPVISWLCLGLIIDKNLINIFTLTYPLQFIYYILKSIFSTGANISKVKDCNKDAVMTGQLFGAISAILIFGIILVNIDSYITFMNMDISIYKTFTIYSIVQLLIQLIFAFVLDKLYFEEENTKANKYSIMFNLLNFAVLIGSSLVTNNQVVIISVTLLSIFIYVLYIIICNFKKFKIRLSVIKCIKYDSVELFNNFAFFIIFLFGLSNALEFGEQYALCLTFIALITDTQWDTFDAIVITSQIDIAKNKFNYIESRNNAYKLLLILFSTSLFMFFSLYWFYDIKLGIAVIYFSFEIINMIIYPIYRIKTCYLQLEWSSFKTTTNKICASTLRMILSMMKNPFCTGIGQVVSSVYQFLTINFFFNNNYKVNDQGFIQKRIRK